VVVVKGLELSWSEKLSVVPAPISVVPGVTLLNDPIAVDIKPDVCAEKSVEPPPPTVSGLILPVPCMSRGSCSGGGAVAQGTSFHSVPGYEALKHPFLGKGRRDMDARQASRPSDFAAGGCFACAQQKLVLVINTRVAAMNEEYPRLYIELPCPAL
jgi:hypothetical protein